jgi:hypothetical protein
MQEIECNLKFKYSEYTSKLNFDNTLGIQGKPYIVKGAKYSKSGVLKTLDLLLLNFKMSIICYVYMILLCRIDYIVVLNYIELQKLNPLLKLEIKKKNIA